MFYFMRKVKTYHFDHLKGTPDPLVRFFLHFKTLSDHVWEWGGWYWLMFFLRCDGFPRRIHLIFKRCRLNNFRSLFKILPIDQKSNLSIELIQYKSLLCFLLCKTLCRQIRILEHSVLISFVQNAKYYLVASEQR